MIESLESRQFLSATLTGEALPAREPGPSPAVETDAVGETKAKAEPRAEPYMTYTMTDVLISS